MNNEAIARKYPLPEEAVSQRFLEAPNEESFADLFKTYFPQMVAFFRARGCGPMAEGLAQEVMLMVYRKAEQVRDRSLFRAWMFKIARNTPSKHYGKRAREVDTVDMADVPGRMVAATNHGAGTPAFEFLHCMAFLAPREKQPLIL